MAIQLQANKRQLRPKFDFLQFTYEALIDKFKDEVQLGRILYWPTVNSFFSSRFSFNRRITRQVLRAMAHHGLVEINGCGIYLRVENGKG